MNQDGKDLSESESELLEALRWMAMPVVVVGSSTNLERSCATGTMSYVSLRPPMISTSLSHTSRTYQLAHESKVFSASLLRIDQSEVAITAARRPTTTDKFSELNFAVQEWSNVPALADCGTVMWCALEQEHEVGDYVLCVGRILKVDAGATEEDPLLRFAGHYHAMGRRLETANETPYPL